MLCQHLASRTDRHTAPHINARDEQCEGEKKDSVIAGKVGCRTTVFLLILKTGWQFRSSKSEGHTKMILTLSNVKVLLVYFFMQCANWTSIDEMKKTKSAQCVLKMLFRQTTPYTYVMIWAYNANHFTPLAGAVPKQHLHASSLLHANVTRQINF